MSEEQIIEKLRSALKPPRFTHTINVADTAEELAHFYGCDPAKARLAGLLHDCARCIEPEDAVHYCRENSVTLKPICSYEPSLIHSIVGAHLAKKEYGVTDEEVLSAIYYHTTGCANMPLLIKILYLADAIEPGRTHSGVELLRVTAYEDLDEALIRSLDATIRHIINKGGLLDADTLAARNYLIKKRKAMYTETLELKAVIADIIKNFDIAGEFINVKRITTGNINTTYRVTMEHEGKKHEYTLQTINKYVFKNPRQVMENIVGVTKALKEKIEAEGGNADRECLNVVYAADGLPYYVDDSGEFWRLYRYISNSYTMDAAQTPEQLKSVGEGFGRFQARLADYPMDSLWETIPNFHDAHLRYRQLMDAAKEDVCGRAHEVTEELDFFRQRYDEMRKISDLAESGELPLRVTHNDTKFNNILIDQKTEQALCVIDLDTVMPGLAVFDFGDAVRFAANAATEEETDLSKVYLDINMYNAFTEGFLSQLDGKLTQTEIKLMALGAKTITMELASRFLADYLKGDKYFKTHREGQNLDRARCQIKLALSMEEKFEEMERVIAKYL